MRNRDNVRNYLEGYVRIKWVIICKLYSKYLVGYSYLVSFYYFFIVSIIYCSKFKEKSVFGDYGCLWIVELKVEGWFFVVYKLRSEMWLLELGWGLG